MKKSRLYLVGWVTLIGFPLLGGVILKLAGDDPRTMFGPNRLAWYYQVPIGVAYGTLVGFLAWRLIQHEFLYPVKQKYGRMIQQFGMRGWEILFLSICAGLGEEILFRGALQPYLGIWPTSILFVFIHGYLNPMDKRIFAYGVFMTLAIVVIGKLTNVAGLISAMIAHTVIDVILLYKLTTETYDEPIEHEEDT